MQGLFILGNQLFPPALLPHRGPVFMAEDLGLCTYVRHHRQKITLFLAAMRSHAEALRERGVDLHYEMLPESADAQPYEHRLRRWLRARGITSLLTWEIEDKFFERRMTAFAAAEGIPITYLPSPMFLTTRAQFRAWLPQRRVLMADFYRWQRQRLGVLVDRAGKPRGGQWSFDADNRQALPRKLDIPLRRLAPLTPPVRALIPLVRERFAAHPGRLDEAGWWLPTTRRQALEALTEFLAVQLDQFGPYEDALSERDPFLFHSVLTPALNLGLITPAEVLERTLRAADSRDVPLASLEGFIRQIIGWREFIRGIYQEFSERQESRNFFGHTRTLTTHWYDGTTGLEPLDRVIRKAQRWGWTHHIERLMVAGNLMTLCEIEPAAAHRWFMEMYVDSSDWVMGPNVYGMGLFADGGIFATKPYLCGSNYLLKMGHEPRTGAWRDTLDGLYWRFIHRHREFFLRQPRLQRSVALFDRMDARRRQRILDAAEQFLATRTGA